ncbi:MAG TPA: putative toxin-antitoxin system toxin component, PIN family [Chitinophagaceae bacterium]|nr:putative toxin-antitoxin system toxin component, PIN family [Chitinophagaceae bacterium]
MSAVRRKKLKWFVLDTNVWISYAINGELEWLAHYVVQNRLLIYASPLLLTEIKKVLQYARVKKLLNASMPSYINVITSLVLLKEDVSVTINSPDPDDDYIFSLAISNNAKAIVCGDKPLLNWKTSPVKVISKKVFEMLY